MVKVLQTLCLIVMVLLMSQTVLAARKPELIDSCDFDREPADYSLTGDSRLVFDDSVYHLGGRSLYYSREKRTDYKLVHKTFDFKPGLAYSATCWIKTKDITSGGGATIAIESYDSKGGYIGGSYINPGLRGNSDWTQLRVPTYRVPANAARVHVVLYITKGYAGKAWFDDLEIYQVRSDLLKTNLLSPAYRGLLWNNGPQAINLEINLNRLEYDIEDLTLRTQLTDVSGKEVFSRDDAELEGSIRVAIPSSLLKPGQYQLTVSAMDRSTGKIEENRTWDIKKLDSKEKLPTSYVDQYGRYIYKGKPFFPLGFYFGDLQPDELAEYADSPFNTVLPYTPPSEEAMDLAQAEGLKVIYTVKDDFYNIRSAPREVATLDDEASAITETVNRFKDHPALLAWYFNDELAINDYRDQLQSHYDLIRNNDENHPAYEVDATLATVSEHINITDIMGTDPYPVLGNRSDPVADAGIWTRETSRSLPNRPIWMAVQAHNLGNYKVPGAKRPPNYLELRSMAWQDICEGATGLIFYSWFDIQNDSSGIPFDTLWADAKKVGAEIKGMVPVIMSREKTPEVTVTAGDWLNWTVRRYDGKVFIFAVNNSRTAREARFSMDMPNGELSSAFEPLEVKVIGFPIDKNIKE